MKNKLSAFFERVGRMPAFRWIAFPFKFLWRVLGRNFRLKLLSLVIAILLWNLVISNSSDVTRTKTLTGVPGYVSGQSVLTAFGFALADDPTESLSDVTVQLEVGRGEFAYVSAENVQVTLDLSNIRSEGTQSVPLKATSTYGHVKKVLPEAITLTFEPLDTRVLPVTVQFGGKIADNMWYSVQRTNPATLTVSGASSLVRSLDRVLVVTDVTDATAPYTSAEDYVLLDRDGKELSRSMINRSSSSVSVSVDVYPKKEIAISDAVSDTVTGEVAKGYRIESVTIQPQTLMVAGDADLLAGVSELYIEPVDVSGLSQSFSVRANVSALSAFKYVSAEEVYVNVTIAEENTAVWIEGVNISYVGKADDLMLEGPENMSVYVSGPMSRVNEILEKGLAATVDLTGMGEGTYSVRPVFPTDAYPDVTFAPENDEVGFALVSTGASAEE